LIEPIQYCLTPNNILEIRRNHKLAGEAWEGIAKAEPELTHSADYADGFKAGYADYLYAGGTGEPPPQPPRTYWRIHYETPEGHQAIEDWFAGFRHGASMAQQSGHRQYATIPSSVRPRDAPDQEAASIAPEHMAVPPAAPDLPPPRKVQPAGRVVLPPE